MLRAYPTNLYERTLTKLPSMTVRMPVCIQEKTMILMKEERFASRLEEIMMHSAQCIEEEVELGGCIGLYFNLNFYIITLG